MIPAALSPQFGVSGTASIRAIEAGTDRLLGLLPETPLDPTQQIAIGCDATGNRFVATG